MKFWPCYSFEIKTLLSLDEVKNALSLQTEPLKWHSYFFSRNHKKFHGTISHDGFKIIEILHFDLYGYRRNIPWIKGAFNTETGKGISVEIKMWPYSTSFMIFWFLVNLLFLIVFIIGIVSREMPFISILVPIFLMVFGWWTLNFRFANEVKAAYSTLEGLLARK